MRYVASGLFVLAVFALVTFISEVHDSRLEPVAFEYISTYFERDTAARNAVAAILMNYRMYDTIYEALILLTAIIGMKAFLPSAKRPGDGSEHLQSSSGVQSSGDPQSREDPQEDANGDQ